jgi:outer membrane protein
MSVMFQTVRAGHRFAATILAAGIACGGTLSMQAQTVSSAYMSMPRLPAVPPSSGTATGGQGTSNAAGQIVTLTQALNLARANEPTFAAAYAASKVARLDKLIARSALLPSVVYHNQYLFTESNHLPLSTTSSGSAITANQTAPVFIANNGIHEYVSQASVSETIGLTQINALARADAASAIAAAELEISRRGLASTVVGLFYGVSVAEGKIAIARRALDEATDFVKQTQQRETAREVAHADVVKAQLALQQRQREMADAELMTVKSRLDLGVLLYPDPRTPYTVEFPTTSKLPTRAETEVAAAASNPELASAVATLRATNLDVTAARAAYLPDLAFNYSYGIDAAQFAINGPDGERNLGFSASATVDIPVWDWLATAHKVKQAQILRDSAKVALSATQRRLIANLEEFYNEARVAYDQLASFQVSTDTARDSLRLTRLRYTNGEATVLEVVDAQNSLIIAELAMQDGRVRYQLALANLQTLTGIL